jgi:hypothetical protein
MPFPIKERLQRMAGFYGLTAEDMEKCAAAMAAEVTRTGERKVSLSVLENAVGKDKAARFRNAVHLSIGVSAD